VLGVGLVALVQHTDLGCWVGWDLQEFDSEVVAGLVAVLVGPAAAVVAVAMAAVVAAVAAVAAAVIEFGKYML
jgi:hypothetical protein